MTIHIVCRFFLQYFKTKLMFPQTNILKSGKACGQMVHRWAAHGRLLTICGRETVTLQFHFPNKLFFGQTRFCLTSGSTENSVGTLDSKKGPWKHIDQNAEPERCTSISSLLQSPHYCESMEHQSGKRCKMKNIFASSYPLWMVLILAKTRPSRFVGLKPLV